MDHGGERHRVARSSIEARALPRMGRADYLPLVEAHLLSADRISLEKWIPPSAAASCRLRRGCGVCRPVDDRCRPTQDATLQLAARAGAPRAARRSRPLGGPSRSTSPPARSSSPQNGNRSARAGVEREAAADLRGARRARPAIPHRDRRAGPGRARTGRVWTGRSSSRATATRRFRRADLRALAAQIKPPGFAA